MWHGNFVVIWCVIRGFIQEAFCWRQRKWTVRSERKKKRFCNTWEDCLNTIAVIKMRRSTSYIQLLTFELCDETFFHRMPSSHTLSNEAKRNMVLLMSPESSLNVIIPQKSFNFLNFPITLRSHALQNFNTKKKNATNSTCVFTHATLFNYSIHQFIEASVFILHDK